MCPCQDRNAAQVREAGVCHPALHFNFLREPRVVFEILIFMMTEKKNSSLKNSQVGKCVNAPRIFKTQNFFYKYPVSWSVRWLKTWLVVLAEVWTAKWIVLESRNQGIVWGFDFEINSCEDGVWEHSCYKHMGKHGSPLGFGMTLQQKLPSVHLIKSGVNEKGPPSPQSTVWELQQVILLTRA